MKDTVWHYVLPSIKGEGWAEFFITSRGVFSAVSDWGNYGYVWTNTGHDDPRKFFLRTKGREDYFTSKWGLGLQPVFEAALTKKNLQRVARTMEPADRQWLLNELKTARFDNQLEYHDLHARWEAERDIPNDVFWAAMVFIPDRQLTAFVTKVLPRLAKVIERELGAPSLSSVT